MSAFFIQIANMQDTSQSPKTRDRISRLQHDLDVIRSRIAPGPIKSKEVTSNDDSYSLPVAKDVWKSRPKAEYTPPKKMKAKKFVAPKQERDDLKKELRLERAKHRQEIRSVSAILLCLQHLLCVERFDCFRHLEWELSRLKHKDPLRSSEIREDEIFFHPQGSFITPFLIFMLWPLKFFCIVTVHYTDFEFLLETQCCE